MALAESWSLLRSGVVGEFESLGAGAPVLPGMLRLSDESAKVTLIGPHHWVDEDGFAPRCPAVLGLTQVGHVLLLEISKRSGGGGGPAAGGYEGRCLVLEPDPEAVDGDLVSAAQLSYFGLSAWAGDRLLHQDEQVRENGRLVGWRTEVRSAEPLVGDLGDEYSVHLLSNWGLDHEFDRRVISMPFVVRVASSSRRSIHQHLIRLDAISGLLALCHRQAPAAETGAVRLTPGGRLGAMWDRALMSGPAPTHLNADFPLVRLAELGGVQAVVNWVRLTVEHPRVVGAAVSQARSLSGTPESRVLATAVAIESWVKHNKSIGAAWAQAKVDNAWPGALTKAVDDAWLTWIGDSSRWVNAFWDAYTAVKHGDQTQDSMRLHLLESAGRLLLTGALLDHCAGGTTPSGCLFGDALWQLGEAVREEVLGPVQPAT